MTGKSEILNPPAGGDLHVTPVGRVSVTVAPVTSLLPVFVTVTVYVMVLPRRHSDTSAVLVMFSWLLVPLPPCWSLGNCKQQQQQQHKKISKPKHHCPHTCHLLLCSRKSDIGRPMTVCLFVA